MVMILFGEYSFLSEGYSGCVCALLTDHLTTCPDNEKMIYQIWMKYPMLNSGPDSNECLQKEE